MKSSWVSINLQMMDFPYWEPKNKDVITGDEAAAHLDKLIQISDTKNIK